MSFVPGGCCTNASSTASLAVARCSVLVSGSLPGAQLWRPSPQDTRQKPTWQLCTLLWHRCVLTDAEWHAFAKQDCKFELLYVVIGYQHDLQHVTIFVRYFGTGVCLQMLSGTHRQAGPQI